MGVAYGAAKLLYKGGKYIKTKHDQHKAKEAEENEENGPPQKRDFHKRSWSEWSGNARRYHC